jgi:hypothetical protein
MPFSVRTASLRSEPSNIPAAVRFSTELRLKSLAFSCIRVAKLCTFLFEALIQLWRQLLLI